MPAPVDEAHLQPDGRTMEDELQGTITQIKPLADTVIEAATALNAAIRTACERGLTVRVDVLEDYRDGDDDPVPLVRARISKRIA